MLLRVVAQSLKPVILLAPSKRTQHCWELLRPFAGSLTPSLIPLEKMNSKDRNMKENTTVFGLLRKIYTVAVLNLTIS